MGKLYEKFLEPFLLTLDTSLGVMHSIGDKYQKLPEGLKQLLPKPFGIGLNDERAFAALLAKLEVAECEAILQLLALMQPFQLSRFINVVTGIPNEIKKETTGEKDKQTFETAESIGLKFLKKLATMVKEKTAAEALKLCIEGRIILKDSISQQILAKWREELDDLNKVFKDIFGIERVTQMNVEALIKASKKMDEALGKLVGKVAIPVINKMKAFNDRQEKGSFSQRFLNPFFR